MSPSIPTQHPQRTPRLVRPLPVFQLSHEGGARAAAAPAAPPHTLEAPEPTNWGPARCLIAATAIAAIGGIPLGIHLAFWAASGKIAQVSWVGWVQAHGQVQLFGWLGLAVLGVTFHAMAHLFKAAEPPARLAAAVLALQLLGVALRLAAPQWPGDDGVLGSWLLVGSAIAFLGAFVITLEAHVRTLPRRRTEGRAPAVLPKFLLVGLLLWLGALLANLDAAINAVRFGAVAPGAIGPVHNAFIIAAVGNGLALIALGMSLRVVVGWLDLPSPDLQRAGQAWWPLAGGAVLRAFAPLLPQGLADVATASGGILWALGVFWYLPALRGLWSPAAVTPGGGERGEGDPALAWFVRAAYAGFAITGMLALVEAALLMTGMSVLTLSASSVADAARHALLFGYLGVLTAGLTGRLPTAFLDVGDAAIAATRTRYLLAWLLLVPASVLRTAAPLAGEWRTGAVMLSGVLGSLGLLCLLAVLAHVARAAYRRDRAFATRRPNVRAAATA
jgi:uncharacterized protein involved in response to NO